MVDRTGLVRTLELRNQVLVVIAGLRLDNDGLSVDIVNNAGVLCDQNLTGVNRDTVLNTGTNQRSLRAKQRHSLALHV